MVHKTFISLIPPFLIITTLNTVADTRTPSEDPNAFSYWIWHSFCRLRDREEPHWANGYWTKTKGKLHSSNKINSRSSGVMKTDVRDRPGGCGPGLYWRWSPLDGENLWMPIFHRKWGTVRQCPAQFQHPVKLMIVWMGLFPEIISAVCKVKSSSRE